MTDGWYDAEGKLKYDFYFAPDIQSIHLDPAPIGATYELIYLLSRLGVVSYELGHDGAHITITLKRAPVA